MKQTLLMSFFIICVTIVAGRAQAQPTIDNPSSTQTDRPWSLGAGIGYSIVHLPYSAQSTTVTTPSGSLLVEKQLSENLAILFDIFGGYSNYNNDVESEWSSLRDYDYHANASAGIRWIFNPGGVVEISGIASASGHLHGAKGKVNRGTYDETTNSYAWTSLKDNEKGYSAGLNIGLALERKLLDNLYLRFQSTLLSGTWGLRKDTQENMEGGTDTNNIREINVGLAFTPMIQLRMEI